MEHQHGFISSSSSSDSDDHLAPSSSSESDVSLSSPAAASFSSSGVPSSFLSSSSDSGGGSFSSSSSNDNLSMTSASSSGGGGCTGLSSSSSFEIELRIAVSKEEEEDEVAKVRDEVVVLSAVDGERRRGRCVGKTEKMSWGKASVIGRRREMEDAVAVVPKLLVCSCSEIGGCTTTAAAAVTEQISAVHFFGVFDGHGGSQVARFCAERMHHVIADEWDRTIVDDSTSSSAEWHKKWDTVLAKGFERTDDEVEVARSSSAGGDGGDDMVGSTAVVALVSGCQIIVSNCGDSRAVLCRGTETLALSVDHKPDREDELIRIESEVGGRVIHWNGARVLGVLSMSRAIGDRYMRPYIIPVPETTFTHRSQDDEFLILASDGLWDVVSTAEAGEVARRLLRRSRRRSFNLTVQPAQFVADHLTQLAMARNSSDNISVVVVDLKSRKSRRQQQHSHSTSE